MKPINKNIRSMKKTNKKYLTNDKDPVEVFCRIKPTSINDICCKFVDHKRIVIYPPLNLQNIKTPNIKEFEYTFTKVFAPESKQKTIFKTVAKPLVQDLIDGKNGLIFAYGVTGSGKTYTMNGKSNDEGILIRCLDTLFNSIRDYQTEKFVFKPDKNNGFDIATPYESASERTKALTMAAASGSCNSLTKLPTVTPKKMNAKDDFFTSRSPDTTVLPDVCEDNAYCAFVSFVEIYNNYIYDLLEDVTLDQINMKTQMSKNLREDANHSMYVNGCTEVEIKSTDDALEVLYKGWKKKRMAVTTLNTESSRSHSIFNVRLVQAPIDPSTDYVIMDKSRIGVSQLALVDLAGSERTARTNNVGERLREAGNINSSLMVLRNCLEALRENQQKFISHNTNNVNNNNNGENNGGVGTPMLVNERMVPYRDSKLTHLFKNYFEGQGKVRMIVCLNPDGKDFEENLHVARFAELTQEVQIVRPISYNAQQLIQQQQKELQEANSAYFTPNNATKKHQPYTPQQTAPRNKLRWESPTRLTTTIPGSTSTQQQTFTDSQLLRIGDSKFHDVSSVVGDSKDGFFSLNSIPTFDTGPVLPNLDLIEFNEPSMVDQLLGTVEQKLPKYSAFYNNILANVRDLSKHPNVNQDNLAEIQQLRKELKEAQARCEEFNTLQNKTRDLEKLAQGLTQKLAFYDKTHKNFENILDENELARRKMEKDMERQLKAKEQEMENKLWIKNQKLRQLKDIIVEGNVTSSHHTDTPPQNRNNENGNGLTIPIPVINSNRMNDPDLNNQTSNPKTTTNDNNNFVTEALTSSDSDTNAQKYLTPSATMTKSLQYKNTLPRYQQMTQSQHKKIVAKQQPPTFPDLANSNKIGKNPNAGNMVTSSKQTTQQQSLGHYLSVPNQQNGNCAINTANTNVHTGGHVASVARMYDAKVATINKGVPMGNPRHYRRRSKSVGELKYLEHKPIGQGKTNDILRPKIKNITTTNALNKRELEKCDKYLLNKQEQDSQSGDIKTQIYKGDVIATQCGGNAIVFNDIEILTHADPKEDKRKPRASDHAARNALKTLQFENQIAFIDQGNNETKSAGVPQNRKRLYPQLDDNITSDLYIQNENIDPVSSLAKQPKTSF